MFFVGAPRNGLHVGKLGVHDTYWFMASHGINSFFYKFCIVINMTCAPQAVCDKLKSRHLGAIVEACESLVPLLVGLLQDWADKGARPAVHSFL